MNSRRTDVLDPFQTVARPVPASGGIPNIRAGQATWGGWGSNPRPADYEKYGLMHHALYVHKCHESWP